MLQSKLAYPGEPPTAPPEPQVRVSALTHRLVGIDAMRCPLLIMLVFAHGPQIGTAGTIANLMSRSTVPFYFLAAGYFLEKSTRTTWQTIWHYFKRLAPPFVFWLGIYLLWFHDSSYWSSFRAIVHTLIDGGPGYHLWFLPSLGFDIALLVLLRDYVSWKTLLALAAFTYFLGLILGNYYPFLYPGMKPVWNTRDGPFFGFPLLVTGLYLAKIRPTPNVSMLCCMGIAALLSEIIEYQFLRARGIDVNKSVMIGTIPYGVAIFLIALRLKGTPLVVKMSRIGRYGLGIYAVHLLVLTILEGIVEFTSFFSVMLLGICTFTLSALISIGCARIASLRPLVK